ncbi:MAG: ABC transporter permease [Coriobacteriia bacterium]|nr:ABC transporter permease [Coriobacteriia bacterium]MBN2821606.1 ABC transporter permease [Coriobacteriia bacterium]
MRNAYAVSLRILRQFKHDPRTLFMMIVAPVLALFLLNVIFGSPDYEPLIVTADMPSDFVSALEDAGARIATASDVEALDLVEQGEADAFVTQDGDVLRVWIEGSDPSKTGAVLRAINVAQIEALVSVELDIKPITLPGGLEIDVTEYLPLPSFEPPAAPEVAYVHGSEDMRVFDFYGPVFIGVFVFFYVFITSGISFVRERTGGTLERLMATPIHRWELVLGYVAGFGLFTLAQSAIVVAASIYWVGFPNLGNFWLVLLIALSMALVSLTLGILVSEFANTELQVMQLMQIIVIPQILLSGMFDLSQTPGWMQMLGKAFPVTYGAEAMRAVMLRGAGFGDVAAELAVLWVFAAVFFIGNIVALRKYRRI